MRHENKIDSLRKDIDAQFSEWFEEATALTEKIGSTVEAPRTSKLARHRANAPSESAKEYYLRNLAIPFIDYLNGEFNERFNPNNRMGKEILALLPAAILDQNDIKSVVHNLMFWEDDLPNPSVLRNEVLEWKIFWESKKVNLAEISLRDCLEQADVDVFPNIRTLMKIGCTLPVTSCETERSFSCLRRTKTYLRNSMTDERLTGLALLDMNSDLKIDVTEVCKRFIAMHNRKMFHQSLLFEN
jgi:hypothetical protein